MDFFCDGTTEEIIMALAKIKELKVISRNSSFYFRGQDYSVKEIGKQLDVNTILEGSIRIRENELRISAQLIQVSEDAYLWSETWNRKLENLFEIQDEISLLIADKLREHMGHLSISDHLVVNHTSNLDAYKHYLKGRYHFLKWNPEDTKLAITLFEKATSLDQNLIDAYLGQADAYSFLAVAGFAPRENAWAKANEALDMAMSIDKNNAGLNYMLAIKAFFTEADFGKAIKLTLASLASEPTHAESLRLASFLYTLNGEFNQAKNYIFYAKSIDPLNPETRFYEGNYYYRIGKYDLADSIMDKLLEENDKNLPALIVSIYLKLKANNWQAAKQQIEEAPTELFTPDERLGLLCLVEIKKGDFQAIELVELKFLAKEVSAHHAHSYLFIAYAMLGQEEDALSVLKNLFENNSSILLLGFSDPLSEDIRTASWFEDYHEKIYPINRSKGNKPTIKNPTQDHLSIQKDLVRLEEFMQLEKPFLNPSLSLRLLANSVGIHPNQLSWLINQHLGKNFNEFINLERIEHFKNLILDPSNAHISLIGLAYESGFNSKSVFNAAFKKIVGMTPTAYLKSHQKG